MIFNFKSFGGCKTTWLFSWAGDESTSEMEVSMTSL